jgi:hypothetical protein
MMDGVAKSTNMWLHRYLLLLFMITNQLHSANQASRRERARRTGLKAKGGIIQAHPQVSLRGPHDSKTSALIFC